MGHIDRQAEMGRQREALRDIARMSFAEERRRKQEFSRTIGHRTLHLLMRIGQAESTSSCVAGNPSVLPAFVTRTSKLLDAALPAKDMTLGIRLEAEHHFQLMPLNIKSPRIIRVSGELIAKTADTSHTHTLELHSVHYANATPLEIRTREGHTATRGAPPKNVQLLAQFIRLLDMTEAILDGQPRTDDDPRDSWLNDIPLLNTRDSSSS
ncbi:MAG: hypothetical protein ABIR37_03305 [Candidatus Saccharimonadales bacterium]